MKTRIFYVEDDDNLSFVTKDVLAVEGYIVDHFSNGKKALNAFPLQNYDICLIDIMLPALDGMAIVSEIRKTNKNIPILFLTAKSMPEDRISGLMIGADDYVTKPYSIQELLLKIKIFLRRKTVVESNDKIEYTLGNIKFHSEKDTLILDSKVNYLTSKESALLKLFCKHPGEILLRDFILNEIWGKDDYFTGRSMDVFITKLRKHLKIDPQITIDTIHGYGYRLTLNK